jgi:protein SCO1/2
VRLASLPAAALLALTLAAGCGGGDGAASVAGTTNGSPFDGAELTPPRQAGDFSLRDQDGKHISLSAQRGKIVLVTFLYTNCPDVCPLIAENLNGALRDLSPAERASVRVLAVSVDPRGDTPAAVRAYARRHHLLPEFRYLIGTRRQLQGVWKEYGVATVARDPELVDHSALTLAVDRDGLGRVLFDAAARPKEIAHDVRVLLAA